MSDIRRKISGSGSIGSLIRDRRGAVAVYIAIITPVMIGIGALTLDLGRVITLHSELQYAADSASLAGARELDRFDGAIKRARAAAAGAVTNIQTFAADGGGKEVAIVVTTDCAFPPVPPCVRFLKTLPADDGDPILPSDVTTKDDEARFMEVHVGARAVTNALIQIVTLGSGPSTISTVASAVAGNDQVICRIPPMFMCNPTEPLLNEDLELNVDLAVLEGMQMEMFHQIGTQYEPGNFGLLCPTGTEGSPCGAGFVKDSLASTTGTCVSLNVAETKTGVTLQMVRTGINARFDYFTTQAKTSDQIPWRTLDIFVPAGNVTQGGIPKDKGKTTCEYDEVAGDNLNAGGLTVDEWIALDPVNNTADNFVVDQVVDTAMGFPRDKCINANNCATDGAVAGNERIGDGIWDYMNYFRINHGCNPSTNPTCKPLDWDGVTGAADWPPTRYKTYRYEIENGAPDAIVGPLPQPIYNDAGVVSNQTAEDGHAQCFQGTPPVIPDYNYFPAAINDLTLLKDRRIMPIAIANCNAMEKLGLKVNGKFKFKIPQFVYVFITEPMKEPSTSEIHVEILGELDVGAIRDLSHDLVQIYRR